MESFLNKMDLAFKRLLTFLIFVLPIDIKRTIGQLTGAGRIGETYQFTGSSFAVSHFQDLNLKLSDLIGAVIFLIVVMGILLNPSILKKMKCSLYIYVFAFILLALFSLWLSSGYLSSVQYHICLLYLLKFFQVSLYYLFVSYYFAINGEAMPLIKGFLWGSVLAVIIGVLNCVYAWSPPLFVYDRVEFFGIVAFTCVFFFALLNLSDNKKLDFLKISGWKIFLLVISAEFAVLLSDKRSVFLGLIIGIVFLFIKKRRKTISRKRYWMIAILIIVSIVGGYIQFYHRTIGVVKVTHSWQGLDTRMQTRLKHSWYAKVPAIGLSYSVTARIARWFCAMDMIRAHPFIGSGFWATQYRYNFLPDSGYLQILVETGGIGFLPFILLFVQGWLLSRRCINSPRSSDYLIGVGWQGMTVALFGMNIGANCFYVYNLMAIYWIFTAMMEHTAYAAGIPKQ